MSGRIHEPLTLAGGNTLSITELDEAILPDGNVFSYMAEIRCLEGIDTLILRIQPAQRRLDVARLSAAVAAVTPFGALLENGAVRLEIQEGTVEHFTTGTAKRKIIDKRV